MALAQEAQRVLEDSELRLRFLVSGFRRALRPVESLLHYREVGERQLELDHLAVAHRTHSAHDMGDVRILETAHDVHYGVRLSDVREELVAESFALRGTLDEAGDVDELHDSGNDFLRLHDVRKP